MNSSFNVEEFKNVIEHVMNRSDAVVEGMNKISMYIENLKTCIGSQESPALYQGWDNLKQNIDKVCQKYVAKKDVFLSELHKYHDYVLQNNDEIYQNIQSAIELINSISQQIDSL